MAYELKYCIYSTGKTRLAIVMMCNKNELSKYGGVKYHETRNRRTAQRGQKHFI